MEDNKQDIRAILARQMARREVSDADIESMADRVLEIGGESRRIESLPEGIVLEVEVKPLDIEAAIKKAILDRKLDRLEVLINGIVNPESYRLRATLRSQ